MALVAFSNTIVAVAESRVKSNPRQDVVFFAFTVAILMQMTRKFVCTLLEGHISFSLCVHILYSGC
jgi:hypothetical protein